MKERRNEMKKEIERELVGTVIVPGKDWQVVEFPCVQISDEGDPLGGYFENFTFVARRSGVCAFSIGVSTCPVDPTVGEKSLELGIFRNGELMRVFLPVLVKRSSGYHLFGYRWGEVDVEEGDRFEVKAKSNVEVQILGDPERTYFLANLCEVKMAKKRGGTVINPGEDWKVIEFPCMKISGDPRAGHFEKFAFVARRRGVCDISFTVTAVPLELDPTEKEKKKFEIGLFCNGELMRVYPALVKRGSSGGYHFFDRWGRQVETEEGDRFEVKARSNVRAQIVNDPERTYLEAVTYFEIDPEIDDTIECDL